MRHKQDELLESMFFPESPANRTIKSSANVPEDFAAATGASD
jgi:hypothetical protein